MWLLKRLTPDFKTLADFRRDNRHAIRGLCRQFTLFCRQPVLARPGLDLFGGELVAIDGSKFKAQNAKGRNVTQRKLKRQIQDLEQKIDEYLEQLDQADEEEKDLPEKPNAEQLGGEDRGHAATPGRATQSRGADEREGTVPDLPHRPG